MGDTNGSGEGTYTVPFLIDGKEVRSDTSFDVVNPATGKTVHKCSTASPADVASAVAAAAKAQPGWAALPPRKRRDVFLRAAEVLEARRGELARHMTDETGCDDSWAQFNLNVAKDFVTDVAGRIATLEGRIPHTQDPTVGALVLQEPYGVVAAIAPWNAPYILGTRAVAFPLAAGNTVVLKGTELAPRTMWALGSVLAEAGLPAGALNVVYAEPAGAAAATEALVADARVRKVNFTGSTAVGRIIGRLAGENLKPVVLELGGKAPAIVWEDADLDLAAQQCALGAFLNAGQICMSTERVLVHRAVARAFEAKLVAAAERLFPASKPAPVLIQARGADKARGLVRDAQTRGASLAGPGADDDGGEAARMRPVVVSGVTPKMDIYGTESFGPAVSVIEVETEEEALRVANDTEYGLSAAVFTEDLRRGLRLARGIEAGAVHVNNMTVHDETALPHGGVKASGFGRFNAGLEEWVRTKTVTYRM